LVFEHARHRPGQQRRGKRRDQPLENSRRAATRRRYTSTTTEGEIFNILEGQVRFRVSDEELRLGAGQTPLAPKGVPQTYLVESERARWLVTTAHGDFERFVRSFSRPAERDDLPEPSPPTPEQAEALAAGCREHGIELVGPPLH
jgi:uncharacterized cupin superfamily protein